MILTDAGSDEPLQGGQKSGHPYCFSGVRFFRTTLYVRIVLELRFQ